MIFRSRGTNRNGGSFTLFEIQSVWNKAQIIGTLDPNVWRKDKCGALIKRTDHGNVNSTFGWEIDHERPVSMGGGDELSNLQPLQWENNRHKSDVYPNWTCKIRA